MPYLIIRKDKEGSSEARESLRKEHRKHLASIGEKLISAGASLDLNGEITGGVIILDVGDYESAKDFAKNDPFEKFSKTTEIILFRQRWTNGDFQEKA